MAGRQVPSTVPAAVARTFSPARRSPTRRQLALWTLGEVLLTMAKMMSPFTPFFAEWVYQHMRTYVAPAHPVGDTKDWATADVCSWLSTSGLGM